MIGVRQVVINGLGDAVDAQLVAASARLLMYFESRVLRIVAADIKEVADVMRLKDLEEPVHVFAGLLWALLEIEFETACAQRGRRRVFEALDSPCPLLADVNQVLVQDAQDAIGAAVNFVVGVATGD